MAQKKKLQSNPHSARTVPAVLGRNGSTRIHMNENMEERSTIHQTMMIAWVCDCVSPKDTSRKDRVGRSPKMRRTAYRKSGPHESYSGDNTDDVSCYNKGGVESQESRPLQLVEFRECLSRMTLLRCNQIFHEVTHQHKIQKSCSRNIERPILLKPKREEITSPSDQEKLQKSHPNVETVLCLPEIGSSRITIYIHSDLQEKLGKQNRINQLFTNAEVGGALPHQV